MGKIELMIYTCSLVALSWYMCTFLTERRASSPSNQKKNSVLEEPPHLSFVFGKLQELRCQLQEGKLLLLLLLLSPSPIIIRILTGQVKEDLPVLVDDMYLYNLQISSPV